MKLFHNGAESLTLQLTELELLTLKASLREAFAMFDRNDFPLRIGVPIKTAMKIAAELNLLMLDIGVEE